MLNNTDLEAFDYYDSFDQYDSDKTKGYGFDDYQKEVDKLMLTSGSKRLIENTLGLVGETGEIAEKIKKHIRDDKELDLEDITKELGDVMFYLAGLASYFNIRFGAVASRNLEKLHDRQKRGVLQGSGDNR